MDHHSISTRGHLFTWMDPYHTNVYVIEGTKNIFVIDTFLGPNPMMEVKAKLTELGISGKPFVVFNTHADYDHYWGNQVFEGSTIIAHEYALRRIKSQGDDGLRMNHARVMSTVKLTPPNLLFRKKLTFVDDRIDFFYTPGHTGDSSSCYDNVDKTLLTGGNLEAPYPYINLLNLKEYTQSLEKYTKLDANVIIPGHDPPQYDKTLLEQNLAYIRGVTTGHINLSAMNQRQLQAHYPNTVHLAELYIEKADTNKASAYYEEALQILKLLDPDAENEKRRSEIEKRISALE